jgi:hypothetical protein
MDQVVELLPSKCEAKFNPQNLEKKEEKKVFTLLKNVVTFIVN